MSSSSVPALSPAARAFLNTLRARSDSDEFPLSRLIGAQLEAQAEHPDNPKRQPLSGDDGLARWFEGRVIQRDITDPVLCKKLLEQLYNPLSKAKLPYFAGKRAAFAKRDKKGDKLTTQLMAVASEVGGAPRTLVVVDAEIAALAAMINQLAIQAEAALQERKGLLSA